jgi:hypothetical protein
MWFNTVFILVLAITPIISIIDYAGIVFEYGAHINKSAFALITGTPIWVLVTFSGSHTLDHNMADANKAFAHFAW